MVLKGIKMKIYKYMLIKQTDNEVFKNKPVYRVYNKKSKEPLGIISYYPSWKEYIFSSKEGCVFNNSCLKDIIDFIENETD